MYFIIVKIRNLNFIDLNNMQASLYFNLTLNRSQYNFFVISKYIDNYLLRRKSYIYILNINSTLKRIYKY